jgi:hypothetical protein
LAIREYEFYHGAALLMLASYGSRPLRVALREDIARGCYAINGQVGLFVKHCSKRMQPWAFTFNSDHLQALADMKAAFRRSFTALVCHDDGIVILDAREAQDILGTSSPAWIRVYRARRGMYAVTGSNGAIERRVANESFASILST